MPTDDTFTMAMQVADGYIFVAQDVPYQDADALFGKLCAESEPGTMFLFCWETTDARVHKYQSQDRNVPYTYAGSVTNADSDTPEGRIRQSVINRARRRNAR